MPVANFYKCGILKVSMKRGIIIFLASIAVILVAAIILFLILKSSAVVIAVLNVEKGRVEVNSGSGWETAVDGMNLNARDSIKTFDDGYAVVVLYESVIVQIEPNTEISLEELAKESVSIKQTSGYTWNKFLGLAGLKTYSVMTPTTVAAVRGTAFGVGVSEKKTEVLVGEGKVTLRDEFGKVVEVKEAVISDLAPEQKILLKKYLRKDLVLMKEIRLNQIKRNKRIMMILNSYNIYEEQLPEYLEKADRGEINLNELIEKLPIKPESLERLTRINDKIIEQRKLLQEKYNLTVNELSVN